MASLGKGFSTGLIIGLLAALFSITPLGLSIEEDLGLTWLFHSRGELAPPPQVAVISIDKASTDDLNLPRLPRKWSRKIHGELLDQLRSMGVKVVAFDFKFIEARDDEGDRIFADAIGRFGNVVLFEQIQREVINLSSQDGGQSVIFKEKRQPPLEILKQKAAATAPFPLPKIPVKVSQFWAFKTSVGEVPTMPVVSLHTALWKWTPALDRAIAQIKRDWPQQALPINRENLYKKSEAYRRLLVNKLSLVDPIITNLAAEGISQADLKQIEVLLRVYAGPNSYYLNLYGPPRSIDTFQYAQILAKDPAIQQKLKGRWVFVGFAEQLQPEQTDYFHTVFSRSDGVDISGVEITATALANLLNRNSIQPLSAGAQIFVIMIWSVILSLVIRSFNSVTVIIMCVVLAAAYFFLCSIFFNHFYQWWPLAIPLMLQLPLMLIVGYVHRHRDVTKERQRIQKAFGYYLPDQIVSKLAKGASVSGHSDLVYGICLATDAEKYTTLSESLEPSVLREFMNEYYEHLFAPVRRHKGIISDVVGDAILALWASAEMNNSLRMHACQAAKEMQIAISEFNSSNQFGLSLPTRVGVHCGEMMIGNVGALDHFEYRAVGDIVNSTNRIQSLNKLLGTKILVSQETVVQLDQLPVRNLGMFLLKGKKKPIHIFELLSDDEFDEKFQDLFANALDEFEKQNWSIAQQGFIQCLEICPQDGPSQFYLDLTKRYLQSPTEVSWPGAVSVVNL